MAHNLDITNGQASFVARGSAWHRLGRQLEDAFDAQTAMTQGLLGGWNVRKVPLSAQVEDQLVQVDGKFVTVRDNPVTFDVEALGIVGRYYAVIQNEDHATFLDNLVHESGAHFETAGALDGGRKVFISMKLPGHMRIGGVDKIDTYIAAINSHDGSQPFTLITTPTRIVCQNTLNVAMGDHSNIHRIRHSGRAMGKVVEAQEALDLTFAYMDEFQAEAERLINTELTLKQFEQIVDREFGSPAESAAGESRTERRKTEMLELFVEAGTQEGIRNTAWAGFNALTEWYEHFAPAQGSDRDARRAFRTVFEPGAQDKALSAIRRAVLV